MDLELIVKASFCTVGTVQMLKTFTKNIKIPGFVYLIVTLLTACAYTLIPMDNKVYACIMVACGSTMFYDTILHNIEKLFTRQEQ